jgi:uncharacterized membrane protein
MYCFASVTVSLGFVGFGTRGFGAIFAGADALGAVSSCSLDGVAAPAAAAGGSVELLGVSFA